MCTYLMSLVCLGTVLASVNLTILGVIAGVVLIPLIAVYHHDIISLIRGEGGDDEA